MFSSARYGRLLRVYLPGVSFFKKGLDKPDNKAYNSNELISVKKYNSKN